MLALLLIAQFHFGGEGEPARVCSWASQPWVGRWGKGGAPRTSPLRQEAKWRGSSLDCPTPAAGAHFSSSGFGTRGMSPWCCWQSVGFPSEAPAQAMLPWHCCEAHVAWYTPTRASLLAEGWTSVGRVQASPQLHPRELGMENPTWSIWDGNPSPLPSLPNPFPSLAPCHHLHTSAACLGQSAHPSLFQGESCQSETHSN